MTKFYKLVAEERKNNILLLGLAIRTNLILGLLLERCKNCNKMNRNEFSIVLPSNSSMRYFPLNTTTNYSTHLPREIMLYDKWVVGLSEIYIPCTTLHLRRHDTKLIEAQAGQREKHFQHGTYNSINNLVSARNETLLHLNNKNECSKLIYDDKGGYITIKEILIKLPENKSCQSVLFTDPVNRILGFEDGFSKIKTSSTEITSVAKHQIGRAHV